jgi:signal transduction histidine kinase
VPPNRKWRCDGRQPEVDERLSAAVDPDDLSDVLGNLMENAVRAAHRHVRIRAARDRDAILFAVANDGAAIDPSTIQALLD